MNIQLLHADSFEIFPQMDSECIDLIVTDPPYGIAHQSRARTKTFEILEGDTDLSWLPTFAEEAFRILKNDTHFYCFTRYDTYPLFFNTFKDAGFTMKRTLIWVKGIQSLGDLYGDYSPSDEWIIFAHKGRRKLKGGRDTNILNFERVSSQNLIHPTEKPAELFKYLIGKSSEKREVVFDPFAGVGSSGIAAAYSNRDYFGIEIKEEYYSKAHFRLKALYNRFNLHEDKEFNLITGSTYNSCWKGKESEEKRKEVKK